MESWLAVFFPKARNVLYLHGVCKLSPLATWSQNDLLISLVIHTVIVINFISNNHTNITSFRIYNLQFYISKDTETLKLGNHITY